MRHQREHLCALDETPSCFDVNLTEVFLTGRSPIVDGGGGSEGESERKKRDGGRRDGSRKDKIRRGWGEECKETEKGEINQEGEKGRV